MFCAVSFGLVDTCRGQWVAFNDHVPGAIGTQTHSNATTLKIPSSSGLTSTNILLKDVATGTNLNVMLTITRIGTGVLYNANGSSPAVGTPLYNTFNGFVYFGAAPDSNVELRNTNSDIVTYTFSGLNPSNRYSFKGGAVRGNSNQTTNWTLAEIQGALSYSNTHSAGVITSAQVSSLRTNQAAVSFGYNRFTGDMIDWEEIDPGADGAFSIACTHYTGPTNSSPGLAIGNLGYTITGIRLEEIPMGPPVIKVQPVDQRVYSGEFATFWVRATGTPPLAYQWYKNDVPIEGATSTNYAIVGTTSDDGALFHVTVSNQLASVTSSNAVLSVSNAAPIITVQPQDQTVTAPATATFSVLAAGSRPFTYQWYRAGSMIAGATNANYTTGATSFDDKGATFSVKVMNSVGVATSSNAVLAVNVIPLIVLPYTNPWRYFTNGTDLGTSWRAIDYDDSPWPQGPGWIGIETEFSVVPFINTTLPLKDTAGNQIRTFYFRTHFALTNRFNSLMLVSSNYIDDGAVFYINGHEFNRFNLDPPPAVITYRTLALGAAFEGVSAIFTNVVPAEFLVEGDNVMAVELHQVNDTSADNVFGMGLTAVFLPSTELTITTNPVDRTVLEATATTFTVGYSGTLAYFQWYKWINGAPVAVPGATKQSLTIGNVSFADAGYYFVIVSNNVNAVASSAALLTVLADRSGPRLVWADGNAAFTQITISFSELLDPATATNTNNYAIINVFSGATVGVTSAVLQNGTNVVLTTSARTFGENYVVAVENVRDRSPLQNAIAPQSAIPISLTVTLIGMTEPGWDFYDPVGPPIDSFEPPPNWKEIDFQVPEDDWGHDAAGLFAYNPNQQSLPAPVNTAISGGAISSYYRFPLLVPVSPLGARLFLRQVVDDGSIMYLNGKEIYRYNMPTGAVDAFTPGTSSRIAFDTGSLPLPDVFLRFGSNVLAAELHGASTSDQDLAFGAELTAQVLSWAKGPVLITSGPDDVVVGEGGTAVFSFLGVGASGVQWQTNGVPVAGGTEPQLRFDSVPLSWDGLYVQVVASNSSSTVFSTNGRLHVIADTTPPTLLDATIQSNAILLTFSEALLRSAATNLSNYRLTNSIGESFQFASAGMSSPSNIVLVLEGVPTGDYRLVVNGVRDVSSAQNEIAANTSARLGFRISIPFDATWKYNTNGMDLGMAWRAIAFDDTTPDWPSGPGLIADETAPLPEPIRTPISRLVNGVYHYTFYFRYHLNLPAAPTNGVLVRFRHVIDDGALMYINGQQFHNFNMTTNTGANVTYTDQASVNVGDAAYAGPFTAIFTNLVVGDNVIAVEVHQNATASSDITFGAEFFGEVPSVVFTGETTGRLEVSRFDGNIVVSWTGNGFTLESSESLGANANWKAVENQINPYFTSAAAGTQRFYRLR